MKQLNRYSLAGIFIVFTLLLTAFSSRAAPAAPSAIVYVHGDITGSQTWSSSNVYVLDGDVNVTSSGVLTIQAGAPVKVEYGYSLNVDGQLILQGTAQNPVVFTSNRDNTVAGDTDPGSLAPAAGDWKGITMVYLSGPGSPNFQNAVVRYATTGLYFQNQTGAALNKPISGSTFEFNQTGLIIDAADGNVISSVLNNQLKNNILGMELQSNSLGGSYPTLQGNLFQNNSGFPLLLRGGSFPTDYIGNTFSANGRQALAVADTIDVSGVWKKVPVSSSPGAAILPYVVEDYVEISAGTTLQIPAGLVVKSGGFALIEVYGQLDLLSTPAEKVVFTSIHDDAYGGDTDGQAIDPASDPWYGIELFYQGGLTTASFDNTLVRFSTSGLMVTNGAAGVYSPVIHDNTFEYNGFGVNMLVGAAGNIQSTVQNNLFSTNEYGLVAAAPTNLLATGSALPVLQNNQFNGQTVYPISLQGSVFPSYSANTFTGNLYPAIAVQGETHRSGAWVSVPGQNGVTLPYVLGANFEIGATYTLSIPAGTVVKSGGPVFAVQGTLDLQSTLSDPVVFTSLNDDTSGGDTTPQGPSSPAYWLEPGARPAPARQAETPARIGLGEPGFAPLDWGSPAGGAQPANGDWGGIELYTDSAIHDAVVRYAVYGMRLINQTNSPINLDIAGSVIDFCTTGISMQAANLGGDINAQISSNQILRSGAGVKVLYQVGFQGVSTPVLHQNNLMLNAIAVENLQTSQVVNAEDNWWGDSSGPYHSSNPAGRGNPVSDAVDFKPYLATPPLPPVIFGGSFLPYIQK